MTWTIDPRKFGIETVKQHRLLCRRIALDIESRLVLATPVDTGRARSNWLASIGSPRSDEVGARDAQSAIAEAAGIINASGDFPVIYLSNNLPYIGKLNDGSSVQAPAAFVQSAIDQALSPLK